jgi:membrane associated rhomboid family serine protease
VSADGTDEPLPLPNDAAAPLVSWALAAVVGGGGAASLLGLTLPLYMDSDAVALGDWWLLWTASLQPLSWLNLAVSVAACLTAGAYAERRLGSLLFLTSYLGAGTLATTVHYLGSVLLDVTE